MFDPLNTPSFFINRTRRPPAATTASLAVRDLRGEPRDTLPDNNTHGLLRDKLSNAGGDHRDTNGHVFNHGTNGVPSPSDISGGPQPQNTDCEIKEEHGTTSRDNTVSPPPAADQDGVPGAGDPPGTTDYRAVAVSSHWAWDNIFHTVNTTEQEGEAISCSAGVSHHRVNDVLTGQDTI